MSITSHPYKLYGSHYPPLHTTLDGSHRPPLQTGWPSLPTLTYDKIWPSPPTLTYETGFLSTLTYEALNLHTALTHDNRWPSHPSLHTTLDGPHHTSLQTKWPSPPTLKHTIDGPHHPSLHMTLYAPPTHTYRRHRLDGISKGKIVYRPFYISYVVWIRYVNWQTLNQGRSNVFKVLVNFFITHCFSLFDCSSYFLTSFTVLWY